jgi:hypothetical protein
MKLFVHVGAPKSATTSVQAACVKNASAIAAAGVGYVGPDDIREQGFWSDFFAGYRSTAPEFDGSEIRSHILGLARGGMFG